MDRLGVLRMWGRKIQGEIWELKEEKNSWIGYHTIEDKRRDDIIFEVLENYGVSVEEIRLTSLYI